MHVQAFSASHELLSYDMIEHAKLEMLTHGLPASAICGNKQIVAHAPKREARNCRGMKKRYVKRPARAHNARSAPSCSSCLHLVQDVHDLQ